MECITCGYYWADVDENGVPESIEYCHFDGPDGWAPCEYENAYEEYPEEDHSDEVEEYERWLASQSDVEEENLYDDEDIEFERYEEWIHDETQRELDEEW